MAVSFERKRQMVCLMAMIVAGLSPALLSTRGQEGLGVKFVNVAREAGITAKTIYGGEKKNKYQLENTGCGVAFFDYDNDGRLDIFLVNGTRLEASELAQEPGSQ